MKRPSRILLLFVLVVFSGCAPSEPPVSEPTQPEPDQRPNILLVIVDDLGWTDIGSYGSEIETPHLDALAKRGVQFTDFYVSVSCSPTRSMLMSGNDNHVAGLGTMGEMLVDNQRGKPGYEGHLNRSVASLPEVLRESGYHTYMAGKWHLGSGEGERPFDRGFEKTITMLGGGGSHWNDMLGLLPMDDPIKYSRDGKLIDELPQDFYSSKNYADELIDMIGENHGDGKPFFGYLAFTAPHDPLHAPEPWLSKYSGQYDDGYEVLKEARWSAAIEAGLVADTAPSPGIFPLAKPWDELGDQERAIESRGMELYAAMVDAMDYHYGRVVDYLQEIGEYDNTVIIFLSDNGANPWYSDTYPGADTDEFRSQFDESFENMGKKGSNYAYGTGFASGSSGPLNRFKMTVSEGGIRVPLLIAGPGIDVGRQTDAFAYVWDIMPTILEVASAEYPAEYNARPVEQPRGRSFLGLLNGDAESIYAEEEFIGGEIMGNRWMRQGNYKATMIPPPYGEGAWHLFDVKADPGETTDLSSEMPEKLATLKAAWDEYANDVGVIPPEL